MRYEGTVLHPPPALEATDAIHLADEICQKTGEGAGHRSGSKYERKSKLCIRSWIPSLYQHRFSTLMKGITHHNET